MIDNLHKWWFRLLCFTFLLNINEQLLLAKQTRIVKKKTHDKYHKKGGKGRAKNIIKKTKKQLKKRKRKIQVYA